MSLDVNGYSDQFRNFLDFANKEIQANAWKGKTSVAQADQSTALGSRTITANSHDKVGKWRRSQDMKDVNDMTRKIFKNAIAEMFGGEKNIPKTVLNAMKLNDYDKGKPLTARRILAVKTAIDREGSVKLNAFKSPDAEKLALSKGWTQGELPRIARAANMLCAATNMDINTAIEKLSTPGSKENRLMNYGGRFLETQANFANGLRLMDSFAAWFKDICDTMAPVYSSTLGEKDFSPADTFTKLNMSSQVIKEDNLKGFEKFAFEELSVNPKANLNETDMEKLFGFKNNKAMCFFGFDFGHSFASTIANIPKEKRAVIYTALNAFTQPANNALEAREKTKGGGSQTWISNIHSPSVIARLLRNFDKAEAMFNAGKLTPTNIIKEFFSEIPDKGDYDYETINEYFNDIGAQLNLEDFEGGQYTDVSDSVALAMENSGCTFEETVRILREGSMPSVPQYLNTGSMPLADFDGTNNGGIKLIEGDLYRPDPCYRFRNDLKTPLMTIGPDHGGFGFTFPGQSKFYTNGWPQGKANIQHVADNVIKMCGAVHVNQANSVMMMLSQSGLSNLRGGIPQVNATSNEHAPVDYTLSKNEQTGAITIRYSSPEVLPFKFEWSATIDVNGNVTTTPMTAELKQQAE